jgi:hypothetical protein
LIRGGWVGDQKLLEGGEDALVKSASTLLNTFMPPFGLCEIGDEGELIAF